MRLTVKIPMGGIFMMYIPKAKKRP